jgi:branched-subunit amino acid aminotransferase/4-amino-4-deoxychorismate lyase
LLELAQAHSVRTQVTEISVDRLLAAEESFLVNSVSGVRAIAAFGGRTWSAAPQTARVRGWLADAQDH